MSSGFFIPLPRHGKRRIGYDQLKELVVPVLRGDQRILPHDVEFIKLNVVQEHIDAAEVVDGQVDLLPEKAPLDVVLAQHLFHLQQQRTGAAGGVVIDLVDPCFPNGFAIYIEVIPTRFFQRGLLFPRKML